MVIRGIFVGAVFLGIAAGFAGCSDEPGGLDAGTSPTGTGDPTTKPTTTGTTPTDSSVPDTSTAQDSSVADTSTGVDSSTADASDGATAPTFTQVYAIFSTGNYCTSCHGAAHSTGLAMGTKALAYTNLVDKLCGAGGAGACANGARKRVVINSAATSTLVDKVKNATPACGARMPIGKAALSAAQIKMVEDWINAGALNN